MKVLVIGAGSIGSRRARILASMGHEVYCVDTDPQAAALRLPAGISVYGPDIFHHWTVPGLDAAFVCTPPANHARATVDCINEYGVAVFVEKPLAPSWSPREALALETLTEGEVTMGACNMRWAYAGAPHESGDLVLYFAKPLSEWRAGAEVAYRANGLILEAAIHEIDVAVSRHGPVADVKAHGDEDSADIVLKHVSGAESLVCASWSEEDPAARWVSYEGGTLHFPDTSDAMYRAEMEHFLACVEAGRETCNPLRSAAHVLEVALRAQEQIAGVVA